MSKRYCVVQTIDGVEVITNVVLASEEIAKERGYQEIPEGEIGAQKKGGKWEKPAAVVPKPDKLEALLDTLVRKGVISAAERPNGRGNG